jgi:hypothetical protein
MGGRFVDRTDPREDYEGSFEKYQNLLKRLDEKEELIKPFHNLWPRYDSLNDFILDHKYSCYVSGDIIPEIKGLMNHYFANERLERVKIDICEKIAQKARKKYQLNSNHEKQSFFCPDAEDVNHEFFSKQEKTPTEFLSEAISYSFPTNFVQLLMDEQMIDEHTAQKWIIEYKRFLTLAYFSKKMITPSEQVDQVWHMHMTYTKHYRTM